MAVGKWPGRGKVDYRMKRGLGFNLGIKIEGG